MGRGVTQFHCISKSLPPRRRACANANAIFKNDGWHAALALDTSPDVPAATRTGGVSRQISAQHESIRCDPPGIGRCSRRTRQAARPAVSTSGWPWANLDLIPIEAKVSTAARATATGFRVPGATRKIKSSGSILTSSSCLHRRIPPLREHQLWTFAGIDTYAATPAEVLGG